MGFAAEIRRAAFAADDSGVSSNSAPLRSAWENEPPVGRSRPVTSLPHSSSIERTDATERVPPNRKLGHGRLTPALLNMRFLGCAGGTSSALLEQLTTLPGAWFLGYKARE